MNGMGMIEVATRSNQSAGLFGVFYTNNKQNRPIVVVDEDTKLIAPAVFFFKEDAAAFMKDWARSQKNDDLEIRARSVQFEATSEDEGNNG